MNEKREQTPSRSEHKIYNSIDTQDAETIEFAEIRNETLDETESTDHVRMSRFNTVSRHQFFEGADRGQLLDILPLLSLEEKNCVFVEAEQGYGKTSLAYQVYVQTLEQERQACMVQGSELATADDHQLLQTLAQHFKIKLPDGTNLENGQALAELYTAAGEKHLVVVIDDAQKMSSRAITLLLEFITSFQKSRVQLVLFALAKSQVLLADSNLQDYLNVYGYKMVLRALNSRETDDYIRFLLMASERENIKLSRQALSRIFQISAGVPSRINEALVYALQDYDQHPHVTNNQRSEIVPKWHLISLALVAVGVLGLIMFGNPEQQTTERFSDTVRSVSEKPAAPFKSPPIQFTDSNIESPRPLHAETEVELSRDQTTQIDTTPLNPVQTETDQFNRANTPERAEPVEPAVTEKVSIDSKIAKLKAQQKPAISSRPSGTATASTSTTDTDVGWLKGMPPNHFTLQLLGGANKGAIEEFVKANGSFRKMGYFETQRSGKPWYIVVYGDFPSRAQAMSAVSQLPEQLRSAQPWPRAAADVQSQMR